MMDKQIKEHQGTDNSMTDKPGKQDETPTLVFVYNADSGLFNTLTDIAHKVFSPSTYQCHLCELSHGHFTMREEWSGFISELDMDTEFLHRDEFAAKYGQSTMEYPAVLILRGQRLDSFIDSAMINACGSIDELKDVISRHCKALDI